MGKGGTERDSGEKKNGSESKTIKKRLRKALIDSNFVNFYFPIQLIQFQIPMRMELITKAVILLRWSNEICFFFFVRQVLNDNFFRTCTKSWFHEMIVAISMNTSWWSIFISPRKWTTLAAVSIRIDIFTNFQQLGNHALRNCKNRVVTVEAQ